MRASVQPWEDTGVLLGYAGCHTEAAACKKGTNCNKMDLGFSEHLESWLFLRARRWLKKWLLKMSLATKLDSDSISPIFLSFEAECKALDNHCFFIVSLTNVLKSHYHQKEGQQYKIELLTSCHWSYWSHLLLFQHEQIQVESVFRMRVLHASHRIKLTPADWSRF